MLTKSKIAAVITAIVAAVFMLSACEDTSSPDPTKQAAAQRDNNVKSIRANQPVQGMNYSSTLDNINRWAKTWGTKGKVSYVYMQRSDGTFAGYYVFAGLPVSYCTGGTPPYSLYDVEGDGVGPTMTVPAPGIDGAYYGNCDASRYYGFDAVTGQYLEYTDGLVLTAVLSDQPLSLDKQPIPFGSSIEDVKASR